MGAKPEFAVLGEAADEVSLLEILDHVLNSGIVLHGSLVISLAGVDLVYIGLNVLVTSVETALQSMNRTTAAKPRTP
jgi:gas vesicle structural protein